MSVILQFIVISQVYFFGNQHSHSTQDILLQLLRGTGLTLLAVFVLAYPDLIAIRYLNNHFPWRKHVFKRFLIQFPFTIFVGIIITPLILSIAELMIDFEEDFRIVFINNAYYFALTNLFLMAILEAWIYFFESSVAKTKAETLEKELSQIRFEVLKNQINPHFMFNSLNVLSGLIEKDVVKAQKFIDEFSHIYRYVLETIEKQAVSLNEELGFVRSYIYLQQIRYGSALELNVNIPGELLSRLLPPLSLQVILENAIKHNIIEQSQPLCIKIYFEKGLLYVKNNIQPKISSSPSTGLGQSNLRKRYSIISTHIPEFVVQNNYYIVKLPLIECDNDENLNY